MWPFSLLRHASADPRLGERVLAHVTHLASTIGERNVFRPEALQAAAAYIEQALGASGQAVRRQTYEVDGCPCSNLEVEIPGKSGAWVVLGAHYDTVRGCPGANDNGSGVAVLLEAAQQLARVRGKHGLRLVAFVNEEPPWFGTPQMGSRVYAAAARARGDQVAGMVSIETVGCFLHTPGTQSYPPGLGGHGHDLLAGLDYPTTGNFLAVVANPASAALATVAARALRSVDELPVETLVTPPSIAGVDWSDHASFWHEGYPAIMLTDTAPFRYEHYHTPDDLPEHLEAADLGRVCQAVVAMAKALVQM